MKISYALGALAGLASSVSAYQTFSGSNLYYAAGLTTDEQNTLFAGLKDAGVQVLRVWLDGESQQIAPLHIRIEADLDKARILERRAQPLPPIQVSRVTRLDRTTTLS